MSGWIRPRLAPALLLGLTVAAGLAVRALLAGWWAKYPGVALWSVALYWLVLLVRPSLAIPRAAALTLALSWAVELFQLTPVPAALASKHVLFRLVLGRDFGVWDLPAYLAGVLLAAALHALLPGKESTSAP